MNKQKALPCGLLGLLISLALWQGTAELSRAHSESTSSSCPSGDTEYSAKDPHKNIPLQALKNGQLVYSPPLPFCQIHTQPLQGAMSGTISPGNYYPDLDQFFDIGWAANQSAPPINALYYNQIGICHLIHNHFREARLAFAKAIQTEQQLQLGIDGRQQENSAEDNAWINQPLPSSMSISQKQENRDGDSFSQAKTKTDSVAVLGRAKSGRQLVDDLNRLGACHNLTQLSENYSTNTTAKGLLEQPLSASAVEPSCRLKGFRHNYEIAAHLEKQ